MNKQNDKKEGRKQNKDINTRTNKLAKIMLIVLIAIFTLATLIVLNRENIIELGDNINNLIERKNRELVNSEEKSVTNIDLTGLVTGEDTEHTHIYEKKYDDINHWEECFICGDIKNRENHTKTTSGTGTCGTYLVESCTKGCGYSISNYVEHDIEYYAKDKIYDETGGNTNRGDYRHGIGSCKRCKTVWAYDKNGKLMTKQDCVDEDGNKINCSNNKKKCKYCGWDYTKETSIRHLEMRRKNNNTCYCKDCGVEIYKVYYHDSKQDLNNNLHYTIRGIYQLLGQVQWTSKTNLPTWSATLEAGAFESLEPGNVIDLPKEYYNNPKYGTEGITSGLYMVQYEAYIKDGYQGTPGVALNASKGLNYVNGNENEYARPNVPLQYKISPDTQAPRIDDVQINKSEIVNGFSKKATITVNAYDSYSDILNIALYDTSGKCIVEYGTATSNGNKTFTRSFDIVAEAKETQTLVVKAKDRYGNEISKNIEIQNLDAKAPTLIENGEYTKEWGKNKEISFTVEDQGIGEVQIAFNDAKDYQSATKENDRYVRKYNFYGDVYDKVTAAIYLKDGLGNERTVKVDIGKLDNTAPKITKTNIAEGKVKITSNDRHEKLGEGSGIVGYRYLTSMEEINEEITESMGTYIEAQEIPLDELKKAKYVYIAPVDRAGNIGNTVKVDLPTYSYSVNYYEEGSQTKVAQSKIVENKLLGEEVEEQAIDVEGYVKVEPSTKKITIKQSENKIDFWYRKRTDISYTVKYLEKGTNKEIHESKVVANQTFGDTITEQAILIPGYDLESAQEQNLTIKVDGNEIIFYYVKSDTNVLVHHYKEGTTEKVPSKNGGEVEDEVIAGKVGESYSTNASSNIAQNYELVADPANKNGTMTESQIVVTYYYRLKTPNITNQVINKTGTDRITIANQEVNYTVTYRANVLDYIGNAEVTIVDTLPYAIDEAKSDLAGGAYDANARTITWKENVQNINSFANNSGTGIISIGNVEVTKTFKVVYVGLDMNQEKVVNNVSGNIKLLTPEKTNEKVIGNQESTIYKAIISSEKLVDKQEAIEGEKVTYTVRIKNEGNLAKTVTLRDTLPAGLTFDKNTLIQVGNLGTVYTEQNLKNGIPVEVPAKGTVDVTFAGIVDVLANDVFSKTLENQATVDNELTNKVTTNVTKPNITAHKESAPSSGSKVVEGDEITYKIKVRNDGTREGRVTVKDTIPAGTTFVEGSIKIGDAIDITKNATDLANGINLTVGVGKEVAVEFKVTVNKLANGTKIKNTAYINEGKEDKKVPEEPEHTYVEPKAEQNITKNGTVKIESLEQEITYNIAYTARITDYKGNAKVVLVDKLPYAIDEARSDLAGRAYNAESNTITWEEPVENIQLTETKEVTINKTIKVVYTGINKDVTSVKNMVTGHIEYETPTRVSEDVTANHTTTTGFIINIPVSKVWEDDNNKLGQRPTKVVFKLTGSDGSEYVKEMAKPGTAGSTTTQDQANPNKWNNIFENLPKYDVNNKEIVYTLTEEEKTEGDLRYYDNVITDKIITNTNKYGKVTVHHYIINTDGSTTTTKVPSTSGAEVQDVVIEGKAGDPYKTESAKNINEKYELVAEKLPANATGTLEKYNTEKPQEVIYYYKLKPAKVIINYLEKDEDTDDSNNQVLENKAELNGYVDEKYNTNTAHRKETIEKEGKTYTLVSNSGNTEGTMTLQDISVTYYYLQNSKATVRYVERNPETGEIVKDLEEPTVKEGLVGDEFVTNAKNFLGYRLVESPEKTTINLSKEEQTLIYYYEPVYSGLVENHIDEITGKLLETEVHDIQIGEKYNIPSKKIEGYDVVETKLPENATGTMGGELITVNYYYIKKAVLEVNYIDVLTNKPLTEQIVDNTKHEGDKYTTTAMQFENYDLVEMPTNAEGTMVVETDENGKITNNKTVVTYYYAKKSAGVEEHHIDIRTNKEIEEPILHEGHIGDEYDIKAKDFLSYKLVEKDEEGNSKLPENAKGTMTEEKIVVNYYYNQPAKVVVHYVEKATGKELEEKNQETGELQSSQIIINGLIEDEYKTEAKEFEYYTLIETELPQNAEGKMKVEIVENEKGEKVVNNTVDVYYYYQAKPFNIGVEKEITGIVVNGERKEISNGKLEKVEIYRKKTEETSVQVEYKIKVRNTGEIVGTATIEENLPEGMKLVNNDGMWEEQDGKLIKVIPEIGAGETKEYTVLLNWEQTGENMGEKANEVKLVETGNVPGFVDNNDKDNTSKANVIISVETGEGIPVVLLIALVGLVGLETVTLKYAVVLIKKQKRK